MRLGSSFIHSQNDECSEGDGGEEVWRVCRIEFDAVEVLQAAEGVFDEMPTSMAELVIADDALSVRSARNDRDDSGLAQALSQGIRIVALLSDEVSCTLQPRQQARRDQTVLSIATSDRLLRAVRRVVET